MIRRHVRMPPERHHYHLNTTKMKRVALILVTLVALSASIASCTASKPSMGGCKATQGMIGYR
jgi:hypothetical protein